MAQSQIRDRIDNIRNSDPLTISGSAGASMALNYNSTTNKYATPFSSTIYANLNLNIYSFNLPFSFYFINTSTSFSYPSPQFSLGMMPTWKNFKFYLGSSSMHFSNYTYSGLSFMGAGMEYQGKLFRAAAFGGVLNRKTNPKLYDDRTAFQRLSDSLLGLNVQQSYLPQYRRDAGGVKVGIGTSTNFIDFSVFKAKDITKTLPQEWRDSIKAQENLAFGLSGRFAIKHWFSFTANLGASFYTRDVSKQLLHIGETDKYVNAVKWLYGFRTNSIVRFAGDAAMNFNTKFFNGSLTYRMIQPDYVSLGTGTFSQNSQSMGINTNYRLFKGRTNLSLIAYMQRGNLNHKQMYMNQVITGTTNLNTTISDHFNINASYNIIKQNQFNGTCLVIDSLRLNQIAHTLAFSPSFSFHVKNENSISLNCNYIQNKNLNKLSSSDINVNTLSVGAGYDINIETIRLTVGCNYDFTMSTSSMYNYNSHGIGANLNYVALSKDKLNLNLNYNGSVAYNDMKEQADNVSFSNSIGTSFSYNKKHTASMYLSLSNYSENIIIGQKVATDFDCRFTLSYSYTFAAKLIKKKSREEKMNNKVTRRADRASRDSRKG